MTDKRMLLKAIARCDQPIEFVTSVPTAFMLLAQLQLALRHPGNTGMSAEVARDMARNLQAAIAVHVPEAVALMEEGWHPEFDVTREEFKDQCPGFDDI